MSELQNKKNFTTIIIVIIINVVVVMIVFYSIIGSLQSPGDGGLRGDPGGGGLCR